MAWLIRHNHRGSHSRYETMKWLKTWMYNSFTYCSRRLFKRNLKKRLCLRLVITLVLLSVAVFCGKKLWDFLSGNSQVGSSSQPKSSWEQKQSYRKYMRGSHVDKSKAALSLESKIFPPARKDFANLYQDDRIYFADGFSQNVENIPSDDSPSLDKLNQHNQHGNNVFKRHELESILEESILKNEAFRNSKNMYLLIFASQWIRSQSSISADDLRSELVIHRKLFEWTEKAHDYGSLFKLTNSERNTLMGVSPDKSEYASQSTGETRNEKRSQQTWEDFLHGISENQMYEEDDDNLWKTLLELATSQVTKFSIPKSAKGKSLERVGEYPKMTLANGMEAWFTPMRYSRMHEMKRENYWMDDFERHVSVIAAFHLDRILGFRRAFLSVGRLFDILGELRKASKQPEKFFVSLIGNNCILGHCDYRCTRAGYYCCGNPDHLEAAITLRIPGKFKEKIRITVKYPWRRSDVLGVQKRWEWDNTFCDSVRERDIYRSGRRLLDIMDLAIFDFLQGNMARQTYDVIKTFGNSSFIVHHKNNYGFGSSYIDEFTILAPLYQCCLIRYSTLRSLLYLDAGPTYLSDYMRRSLSRDPLNPILLEPQLLALDRRLRIVLKVVYECIDKNGEKEVVLDDGI